MLTGSLPRGNADFQACGSGTPACAPGSERGVSVAAEGDRSENAESIDRKKELREIDRRVHYLQMRLPYLKVVNAPPSDRAKVFVGAWIMVVDDDGGEKRYRIVGPDEIDPALG